MNGEYFLDAITISKVDAATGSTDSGKVFNLEPTRATISASLLGADNGDQVNDKLKVDAPASAQGATVDLYRVVDGVQTLVATATLNEKGNRVFKVADENGIRRTQYIAEVSSTESTLGAWTNS